MANPRIRIKRGFGIPIENDEILLSRGELAFDESNNKLYIGKGLADTPVSGNPSQAEELVDLSKFQYIVNNVETLTENQEITLIVYARENIELKFLDVFVETGSLNYELIKSNGISTEDEVLLSSPAIELFDAFLMEGERLYLKLSGLNDDPENLTIQLTYR
jgi:hypothetical protein